MVDVFVLREPCSCAFACADDDVARSVRQVCAREQVSEHEGGEGCLFCGFADDAASCGERGCDASQQGYERIVPRRDMEGDSDGFAQGEGEIVFSDRDSFSAHFVGGTCVEAQGCDGGSDIALCLREGFSCVQTFDDGESRGFLFEQVCGLEECVGALCGGALSPCVSEGVARGGDGLFDFFFACRAGLREYFAASWVEDVYFVAVGGGDAFSCDVLLAGQVCDASCRAHFFDIVFEGCRHGHGHGVFSVEWRGGGVYLL